MIVPKNASKNIGMLLLMIDVGKEIVLLEFSKPNRIICSIRITTKKIVEKKILKTMVEIQRKMTKLPIAEVTIEKSNTRVRSLILNRAIYLSQLMFLQ
jgi:hypothetical protein